METKKLFISYSWSNPDHQQWVIDLATQLRESGVDVILDKWDLKEGHDAYAFMEKMVTDATITKVAIIADQLYAEKADGRKGGVGTETQIISREVYESQEQGKFVLVVSARDEEGKPYLPTYYKGRIFIDLSSEDRYAEGFEQLLRWVYDKPLHVKPELGNVPAFLSEQNPISSGTASLFHRANDAIKNHKPHAMGAVDEYLSGFAENLERFRIDPKLPSDDFPSEVIKSVEMLLPARNEFIQMMASICVYRPSEEMGVKLHRFFEKLIPYMFPPPKLSSYREWDFDNFSFFIRELFLYTLGISFHLEQFTFANELVSKSYYSEHYAKHGRGSLTSFSIMSQSLGSFERYDQQKNTQRRLSYPAYLLNERSKGSGYDFSVLMQADLLLFMRSQKDGGLWWPDSLIYASQRMPFLVFARCESTSYFAKVAPLFGVSTKEELRPLMDSMTSDAERFPFWNGRKLNPRALLDFDNWCKKS